MKIEEIELDKIRVDSNQPRRKYSEKGIQRLAKNILRIGLRKPIELDENYQLIDGRRRCLAFYWIRENTSKNRRYFTIPAYVQRTPNKAERLLIQLSEDTHTDKYDPIDFAAKLKEYKESINLTNVQVARQIFGSGRKEKKVRTLLSLLELPDEGKVALERKKITLSTAGEISRLKKHPEKQKEILEKVIEKKQSPHEVCQEVKRVLYPNSKSHVILVVVENEINWTVGKKIILAPFKSAERFLPEMESAAGYVHSCKIIEDGK